MGFKEYMEQLDKERANPSTELGMQLLNYDMDCAGDVYAMLYPVKVAIDVSKPVVDEAYRIVCESYDKATSVAVGAYRVSTDTAKRFAEISWEYLKTPSGKLLAGSAALLASELGAPLIATLAIGEVSLLGIYGGEKDAEAQYEKLCKDFENFTINDKKFKDEVEKKLEDVLKNIGALQNNDKQMKENAAKAQKFILEKMKQEEKTEGHNMAIASARTSATVLSDVIGLTTSDPKKANVARTVLLGGINLYQAAYQIKEAVSKFRIGDLTTNLFASALTMNVASMVSVGISFVSLLFGPQKTELQIVRELITDLQKELKDLKEEINKRFEELSKEIKEFRREMNIRFDFLDQLLNDQFSSLFNYIDAQFTAMAKLSLALMESKAKAPTISKTELNTLIIEFGSYSKDLSKNDTFTGYQLPDTELLFNVEGRFELLRKIVSKKYGENIGIVGSKIANPFIWQKAAFLYMQYVERFGEKFDSRFTSNSEYQQVFKEIINAGIELREFISKLQQNKGLFDNVIQRYIDNIHKLKQCSKDLGTVNAKKLIMEIQADYIMIKTLVRIAFSVSFEIDDNFRSFISDDNDTGMFSYIRDEKGNIVLLRLLSGNDLETLDTRFANDDSQREIAITYILNQLILVAEGFKGIVDKKVDDIKSGITSEPYELVEYTMGIMGKFANEFHKGSFENDDDAKEALKYESPRVFATKPVISSFQTRNVCEWKKCDKRNFDNSKVKLVGSSQLIIEGYNIKPSHTAAKIYSDDFRVKYIKNSHCKSQKDVVDGFEYEITYVQKRKQKGEMSIGNHVVEPEKHSLKVSKDGKSFILEFEEVSEYGRTLYYKPVSVDISQKRNLLIVSLEASRYCITDIKTSCKCFDNHERTVMSFYQAPWRFKTQLIDLETGLVLSEFKYDSKKSAYFDSKGNIRMEDGVYKIAYEEINLTYQQNFELGVKYFQNGLFTDAVEQFTEALNKKDQFQEYEAKKLLVALFYNRSKAYSYLGKVEESINDRQAIYDIDKEFAEKTFVSESKEKDRLNNAIQLNNLGVILSRQEKLEEAKNALDDALKINPKFPLALRNRALIKKALGDLEGAEEDYKRADQIEHNKFIDNMIVNETASFRVLLGTAAIGGAVGGGLLGAVALEIGELLVDTSDRELYLKIEDENLHISKSSAMKIWAVFSFAKHLVSQYIGRKVAGLFSNRVSGLLVGSVTAGAINGAINGAIDGIVNVTPPNVSSENEFVYEYADSNNMAERVFEGACGRAVRGAVYGLMGGVGAVLRGRSIEYAGVAGDVGISTTDFCVSIPRRVVTSRLTVRGKIEKELAEDKNVLQSTAEKMKALETSAQGNSRLLELIQQVEVSSLRIVDEPENSRDLVDQVISDTSTIETMIEVPIEIKNTATEIKDNAQKIFQGLTELDKVNFQLENGTWFS